MAKRRFQKKVKSIIIDVEADGPCPGLYSMVSFGAVQLDVMENTFYREVSPLKTNRPHIPDALAVSGFTREQHEKFGDPEQAIYDFANWIDEISQGNRVVMWSDNPAFDWQFVNYYFTLYNLKNPLGFSARRIGDFYAGLRRSSSATTQYKRFRETEHTHNALDDAIGNAEAMHTIAKMHEISFI